MVDKIIDKLDEYRYTGDMDMGPSIPKAWFERLAIEIAALYTEPVSEGEIEAKIQNFNDNYGASAGAAFAAACTWIQQRQITDKWISVEDRLPEEPIRGEKIPVLITEGFNGPVYEAFYEGGGDFCTSMYGNYPTVTHWMPIPNPPNKQ